MSQSEFAKTYFSAGRRYEERHGYMRFFPKSIVSWYFGKHQKELERVMRNYEGVLPDPKGLKVLEIGCGQGQFAQYCGKEGYVGMDMWEDGVKRLRGMGYNAIFADASKRLPFQDGSFDIIYAEQVIEHISDGAQFAREMWRVLRPGGKAIVRTVDIARCKMWFYQDYTHRQPYTPQSLYRLMEDSGFEVKELGHGVAPNSFITRRLGNLAIILPKAFRKLYFERICRMLSYELYAIGMKKQ